MPRLPEITDRDQLPEEARHNYDLISDAAVTVGLFVGLGIGLQANLGPRSVAFGVSAGLAVAAIFHLRNLIERRHGKGATRQAKLAGFETEDVLYLIPLVTLTEQQTTFLVAAAVGAPIAFLVVLVQFLKDGRVEDRRTLK